MNRFTTCMSVCLCASAVVAIGAQERSSVANGKDMPLMKVTGCVMDSGGQYMLDHAMMSGTAGKSSSGTASREAMTSYTLIGGDLKSHVGHRVEVTGMMSKMSPHVQSSPDASTGRPGTDSPGDVHSTNATADRSTQDAAQSTGGATRGRLDVKSVKMIAANCS